jgi:hypothetical protein
MTSSTFLFSKVLFCIAALNTSPAWSEDSTTSIRKDLTLGWSRKFCSWRVTLPDRVETRFTFAPDKIIGMALGPAYTMDKLIVFCKSIRLTGFSGEVLIGVSKLKGRAETRRKKMFDKFNISGLYLDGLKGGSWSQSICRYYAYLQIVDHFATESDVILLTDVRDVFFQKHPFHSVPFGAENFLKLGTNLLLFHEGLNDISKENVTLRNTAPNFRWLTNIYGYKKMNLIGKYPPLCSGTTIGTKVGMQLYLKAMLNQGYLCVKKNPQKYIKNRGHICSGGADQGFHNFLFWNNRLPGAVSLNNGAGPVFTIGIFRGKPVRSLNFERNKRGEVLSPLQRGSQDTVPVIHQWDRHRDLVEHVYQMFELDNEGITFQVFSSQLSKGSFTGKHH